MKPNRFNSILRRTFQGLVLAGNTAADDLLVGNGIDGGATFTIEQDHSFFVPYGEYPHHQGLQQFDRAAADAMAANHRSLLGRAARMMTGGYPVYIGHPDIPGTKDTDKRAYGWIDDMVAENDGMRFSVKWSDPGKELVANAHFKFYSPAWWLKKYGKVMRPVGLKSMGLTNDPNIDVPALANESPESGGQNPDEEKGKEDGAAQIVVPKEILDALGMESGDMAAVLLKLAELKQARADAEADGSAKAGEIGTLTSDKKKAVEDLAAANSRVAALTGKLRIVADEVGKAAVAGGRITPADADAKVTELLAANDLPAALAELGKLPVKFKTESKTGDLGQAKTRLVVAANDDAKAAREERATLVANEYDRTNPSLPESERKRIAWERAREKNPEAFSKPSSDPAA